MGRRWTDIEDDQIRASARHGLPDLATVARIIDRTYFAVRTRASRIGSVREFRQKPPTTRPDRSCAYCGATMRCDGRAVCCSEVCKTLRGGHCAGCGRRWHPGDECQHCARVGKRARWPGPAGGDAPSKY